MNILSKFNRIYFNYSDRLSSNEHAAAFVDEVRQMIQEHEQPYPASNAWIRQVKHMIAYAEAMGFLTEDDEIPTDDIFANLDRIAAQPLPAPPQADEVCEHCRMPDGLHAVDCIEVTRMLHGDMQDDDGKAAEVTG